MNAELVSIDRITVLDFVERPLSKVADDRDRQSIQAVGIQQPLVCIAADGRLLLAKGLRRLRIAKGLGLGKVPVVVAPVPRGYDAETYVRELRLALDMHRQDLLPSQKCWLVETLKTRFGMNNKQVAAHLGIDQDSVTNWMAVRAYVQPVVEALDGGRLTMQAARVFDGMTDKGQETLWKRHADELTSGATAHKELRAKYPPADFPKYYRNPELTGKRLKQKARKRRGREGTITTQEKRRLNSSLEMKELELREGAEDERRLKAEIQASIAPLAAIMRSEKLRALVPADMREEIDRFAEIYI